MTDTEQRLLKIFNSVFHTKATEIDQERALTVEWDSMKHAELIIQLQKEFKMKFTLENVLEVKSLKDFVPLVQK